MKLHALNRSGNLRQLAVNNGRHRGLKCARSKCHVVSFVRPPVLPPAPH